MQTKGKKWLRILVFTLLAVGAALAGCAVAMLPVLSRRNATANTTVVKKELRFYKDAGNWYADVPQHTKAQNQMVAGADALLESVADGGSEVKTVLSSDVKNPDKWLLKLHIVEHDKYGATYSVKANGRSGFRLAWICNVAHTVFGGEHPTEIFVHSITNNASLGR